MGSSLKLKLMWFDDCFGRPSWVIVGSRMDICNMSMGLYNKWGGPGFERIVFECHDDVNWTSWIWKTFWELWEDIRRFKVIKLKEMSYGIKD